MTIYKPKDIIIGQEVIISVGAKLLGRLVGYSVWDGAVTDVTVRSYKDEYEYKLRPGEFELIDPRPRPPKWWGLLEMLCRSGDRK